MTTTRALVIALKPEESMPRELRSALKLRADATLSGTCECGAVMKWIDGGIQITHETSCTASDEAITPQLKNWARETGLKPQVMTAVIEIE